MDGAVDTTTAANELTATPGAAGLLVRRRRGGRASTAGAARRAAARRRFRRVAVADGDGRRRPRPLSPPRGAAVARHVERRLPRLPLPRLDVRRRWPLRRRAVGGGRRPVPPKAHLPTLHAPSATGSCGSAPATPRSPIPDDRRGRDPAFRRINSGVERWATSATRMTDNFLDIAHFPYVHAGTFGTATEHAGAEVRDRSTSTTTSSATGTRSRSATTLGARLVGHRRPGGHAADDDRVQPAVHGPQHDPLRDRARPRDPAVHHADRRRHSYFTFVVWRNDDYSVPAEEVIAFDRAIGAEDKRMLERVPGVLPLDADGDGQRAGRPGLGRVAPAAGRRRSGDTSPHAPPLTSAGVNRSGRRSLPAVATNRAQIFHRVRVVV